MLNDRQERFCREYIIDLNATNAALRADYSKKTARAIGSRLLTNVDIQARLSELQAKPLKKLEITAESVLQKFVEIRDRCLQEEPVYKQIGDELVPTGEYKFDASNALRANEALGKHLKLFTDKVEHSGEVSIVNRQEIFDKYLKD
jgi:phage terminase small subunit